MDLQHARTLLERINRVFDDIGAGDNGPSALERDLLKEYVRRFYDSLSDETAANYRNGGRPKQHSSEGAPDSSKPSPRTPSRRPLSGRKLRDDPPAPPVRVPPPTVPTALAESTHPPTVTYVSAASTASAKTAEAPPSDPAPSHPTPGHPAPQVPKAAPAIIQVPDSVEADVRTIERQTPVPQRTVPTVATRPAAPADSSPPAHGRSISDLEPALRDLFTQERGTDLGDRLGNAPIPDLTRALALNQRLVFQNQLFGKDADALRDTLTEVNNEDGYEEAALSLVTTARKYDWTDDERRTAARDFVKLVQRRYARP